MSTLVSLLVFVLVIALIFWLLTPIPIAQPFKTIIQAIVVLIAIVWLLRLVGVSFP